MLNYCPARRAEAHVGTPGLWAMEPLEPLGVLGKGKRQWV